MSQGGKETGLSFGPAAQVGVDRLAGGAVLEDHLAGESADAGQLTLFQKTGRVVPANRQSGRTVLPAGEPGIIEDVLAVPHDAD